MTRLTGKVAIVTGAGSGIGRSIALRLAADGARVVCADISGEQDGTASEIGDAAVPLRVDVRLAAEVEAMVALAERDLGGLDVLCNNAGFGGPREPIVEQDESTFDDVIDVNLRSVFLGMKYGIAAMLRTGGGSVVNTASAAGLVGFKKHGIYAASKAGVIQLTKCAALEYATQGVRVNAICPGMTWTGLAGGSRDVPVPPDDAPVPPQPMARWGLPGELAAAAAFLASDDASFITGVALPVDGGYVA